MFASSVDSVPIVPALQVPPPPPPSTPPPRSCLKRQRQEEEIYPRGVLLLGGCDESQIKIIRTLFEKILKKFPVIEERCDLDIDGNGFSMTLFFEISADYDLTMKRLEDFQKNAYKINVTNYHCAKRKIA